MPKINIIKLICIVAVSIPLASAQAVRVDIPAVTTVSSTVLPNRLPNPPPYAPILAVPYAQIQLFGYPANANPPTNYATTYTDATAATACVNPMQVVIAGTNVCTGFSDGQGNAGFWLLPGNYNYTETVNGIVYGPFPITAGLAVNGSPINATSYGADPSGTRDSTAAINLAFASSTVVMVPPGNYLINGAVVQPGGSELILYPGTYTLGNLGQFAQPTSGAKLFCPGGPENTFISVPSTYAVTTGVVYMTAIEPSGTVEGCQIQFAQPDTSVRANLTHYAAYAVSAVNQPRAQIRNVKIAGAWNGIDFSQNSGGSMVDGLKMSSFNIGINIDGAQDSMRINDFHWFPFELTTNQQTAFFDVANIGIKSGRCDDIHITNSLFIGGQAINLYSSSLGTTYGSITATGFDTFSGIAMSAGTMTVNGGYFSLGTGAGIAIKQTGGTILLSAVQFGITFTGVPPIQISGNATRFSLTGSYINTGINDLTAVSIVGGSGGPTVIMNGDQFIRGPDLGYTHPTITVTGAGRLMLTNNYFTDKGAGTAQALTMDTDSWSDLADNMLLGWSITVPGTITQLYIHNNWAQGP